MPWYLYHKIFHLVGMVSWMAGLFYLPRLFVYHAEARELPDAARGPVQQQLTLMMGRLLNIIMTPAMLMTFIGGIGMLWLSPTLLQQPWMHVKLTLVIALAGYQGWCSATCKKLTRGEIVGTAKGFRIANEVPTVALVLICTYVELKNSIGLLAGLGVSIVMIVLLGIGIQAYAIFRRSAAVRVGALCLLAVLGVSSAGALHAQSKAAPSIDTVRYRALRVTPSATDATIRTWDTTHVVYYDPAVKSNRILLWLAGTNGTPLSIPAELFNTALAQGYRVIALSYITVPAVSQVCVGDLLNANINCAEQFRRKRIYGDNTFASIADQPQDAIIPRLSKLLQWLRVHDASGNWSEYLAADGTTPNWKSIAVSGQSQGGGMAEFIAQQENVARVISFSGGWDYANSREKKIAGWYSKKSVTPMEKWFATYNVNELAAAQIREISNALRIPSAQIFALDKPLLNANAAASAANPYHGDGIRNTAYKSVWLTMLGSGIN